VPVLSGRRAELSGATAELSHLRAVWLAAAVVAELASLAAYVGLQRRLLAAGGVSLAPAPLAGITLAGNALQNSLPGGPAWSAVFAFRQFRRRGVDPVLAGWTMVAVSVVSGACLVAVALAGLALAQAQASSLDLTGVVLVVAALAVAGLVAAACVLRSGRAGSVAVRAVRLSQRLLRRPAGDPNQIVARTGARLVAVRPSRPDWAVAAGLGVSNWLLDCAALALAFLAVRASVPWRGLLFAYGTAQLAANLPITPGGLGVVEGSLSVALVVYGGVEQSTVAAVLLYRIVSFWAVLPLGWLSWLTLRWLATRGPQPPDGER
jgi:uncharacterized membrane protein YbhN (UPF0104 family)